MSDDANTRTYQAAEQAGPDQQPLALLLLDQLVHWQRGERMLVETYLDQHPWLRADADGLLDLIYREVLLRERGGETPRLEEYLERFPHLESQLQLQFDVDREIHAGELLPSTFSRQSTPSPGGPTSAVPAAELPVVPGYQVLAVLGQGGMGVAYKAWQVRLKRLVALKMIRGGDHADPEQRARFRTEAEAVARLQHPNIVQIYEVGEHGGRPYMALEYVEGGSLDKNLDGTPWQAPRAAELVQTVAWAVQHAHQRGVVHRDLKPANVLLSFRRDPQGSASGPALPCGSRRNECLPKITDFGLAKCLEDDSDHTRTGAIFGTPSYMAPEQAAGRTKDIGPAADVYALGAILYELLTGRPPFKAPTPLETLQQVRAQEPIPVSRLQPAVPRDLETICLKCLEKEPPKRYATTEELAEELGRFLRHEPIRARPVSALARAGRWCRRNPRLALASGLAAGALVAVAAVSTLFAVHAYQAAEDLRGEGAKTRRALNKADFERGRADERTRLAQSRLAESYLDQALILCLREQDAARGMLWLARALGSAPKGAADLRDVIRLNLTGWGRTLPSLKMVFPHSSDRANVVAFSPDSKIVFVGGEKLGRLWSLETGKPVVPPLRHDRLILAAAFSPDGKTLVTGCGDKTARLWDTATGRAIGTPLRHQDNVAQVAFSRDSKTAVTGSWDGTARLWEAATGKPVGPALQHQGWVTAVVPSPDGKTLLTGSRDRTARLWNMATGEMLAPPFRHQGIVMAVALSPDGKTIAVGGQDGTARLWRIPTGQPIGGPLQHGGQVGTLAFSPDGKTLLTGSFDRTARFWDAATGNPVGQPLPHRELVLFVAFSPDGKMAVTVSNDRSAWLWDTATTRLLGPPLRHGSQVQAPAFSPDGKTLLTGSFDRMARLWKVPPQDACAPIMHPRQRALVAFFSLDGKTVLTAGLQNDPFRLWSATTGKALTPALRHGRFLAAAADFNAEYHQASAFSADGQTMLTASADGTARVRNTITGNPLGPPLRHQTPVVAGVFSPDGQTVLTVSKDGMARLWKVATGRPVGKPLPHHPPVVLAVFSPSDSTLLTTEHPTGHLWDMATGKPIGRPLRHRDILSAAAFSPDGQLVLTGSWDNTACLWSATTGDLLRVPMRHQSLVNAVAFSPDGKIALTGSKDRTARLWSTATGKAVGPPFQHEGAVFSVAFSPDGRTILTGSEDHTARLWSAATGKAIGPPLLLRAPVRLVAFHPKGHSFLTVSKDQTFGLWPAPAPLSGTAERIRVWAEVITGMELDEHGVARVLLLATWQKRRQRLDQLGGLPLP